MSASSDFVSNVRTNCQQFTNLLNTLNALVSQYQNMGYAASLSGDATAFLGSNSNQNAASIANFITAVGVLNTALSANNNAGLIPFYMGQA